jgi:hypothetical protein
LADKEHFFSGVYTGRKTGQYSSMRASVTDSFIRSALAGRRQAVFGASVLLAGFSTAGLCFCPILFAHSVPVSVFFSPQEENFFFSLFGFISAAWLLTWVCSLNSWMAFAKLGQWLGLVFLCVDQVSLLGVWRVLFASDPLMRGLWVAPLIVQIYLCGSFFGFFTLPGLTRDGNRTLTGLGTLALLLPWLVARDEIVTGLQHLHGLFW